MTYDHIDVVRLLLEQGANKNLRNIYGQRPIDMTDNEDIQALLKQTFNPIREESET